MNTPLEDLSVLFFGVIFMQVSKLQAGAYYGSLESLSAA